MKVKSLLVDEFLAAERFYYFPEPLYYRFPTNTDQVFEDYLKNPDKFEEFEIPRDYLILRHHDLRHDLQSIGLQGQSKGTKHKFYYYKGMVDILRTIIDSDDLKELERFDIVPGFLQLRNQLQTLKESLIMTGEVHIKINLYYYFKGQADIFRQLILNTPLMVKHEEEV